LKAKQDAEKGGFARAIRTDNGVNIAARNGKVQMIQGAFATVHSAQCARLNHVLVVYCIHARFLGM
jgi:hypothetical protein